MERDDFLQQTPSGKLRKAVINHEASTLNARPAQAASEASVVETGAQAFLPDEVIVSETSTVQPMSAEAAGDLGVVGNEKKTPLQKAVCCSPVRRRLRAPPPPFFRSSAVLIAMICARKIA